MPKKRTLFVIIAGNRQHPRAGTHYITERAGRKTTTIRSKATKFSTFAEAQEFAERNHITLHARTCIGEEDFTDFDLREQPPYPARYRVGPT